MSTVLADDRDAILLLCSSLSGAKPLTLSEWASLAVALHQSELESPARLFGKTAEEIHTALALDSSLAQRAAGLLERGGPLAVELERLETRGVWLLTRADEGYPARLKARLKLKAPPVLYGVGDVALVDRGGLAVVGSRDAADGALQLAAAVSSLAAREGLPVISGGARGIDRAAMSAALESGGGVVGVLADSLTRTARGQDIRGHVEDGVLALLSPYGVDVRFTSGTAMGRNKLIYCLADLAVVVSSASGSGGTWAGAVETLRHQWIPIQSWVGDGAAAGNRELLALGARELREMPASIDDLHRDPLVSHIEGMTTQSQGAFDAVWPLLEAVLRQPASEIEVSERLELVRGQARAWLAVAVDRGLVNVASKSPKRFVVAQATDDGQVPLFDV